MYGQYPIGADSWCAYQRSKATGNHFLEKSARVSAKILNVKSEYKKLCDKQLLQKCLYGVQKWGYGPEEIYLGRSFEEQSNPVDQGRSRWHRIRVISGKAL
ncbi:hypothetical protein TNCV_4116711 [Trichonephila clavipes]|nr:hypothetical protein TNCV_4116711 [Trichonephila clavipes]